MNDDSDVIDAPIDHAHPAITRHDQPLRHLHARKLPIKEALAKAFDQAMKSEGKLSEEILDIEGMSGRKYRYFINNLVEHLQSPCYLEVGSWAGSTLCSAIYGNALKAVAVDNWSEFGGPMGTFFKNVSESCSVETRVSVINSDFRRVDFASLGKFNIYLFDGPHTYADHYDALALVLDCMENQFIFIVDDWNWEQVRVGTMMAIADLNLAVMSAIEIRTTMDNSSPEVGFKESDWHNGYYICVLHK